MSNKFLLAVLLVVPLVSVGALSELKLFVGKHLGDGLHHESDATGGKGGTGSTAISNQNRHERTPTHQSYRVLIGG